MRLLWLAIAVAVVWIGWRFRADVSQARARAIQGAAMVSTRCGPIEYEEAGQGVPLLMVRGCGTYASAEYTASRIANAKFIGLEQGGHLCVGHDDEARRAMMAHVTLHAKLP
jgi:hypothetical protein